MRGKKFRDQSEILMTSPILSAATYDADFSILGMLLFLIFAIALAGLIWWLLWLIGGKENHVQSETKAEEPKHASEPTPATTHEPEKKTDPDPEPQPAPEPEAKPEPEKSSASEGVPEIDTASESEAANKFSDELANGSARQDAVYGIVYNEAPETIDDLKKIKGVAKVLEGKLNGVGVYRFKQIAVWTDAACQEFSKMLTFKDRIYRDDWIAQAKEFHREKYGEDI